jgi:hypothetical protein
VDAAVEAETLLRDAAFVAQIADRLAEANE